MTSAVSVAPRPVRPPGRVRLFTGEQLPQYPRAANERFRPVVKNGHDESQSRVGSGLTDQQLCRSQPSPMARRCVSTGLFSPLGATPYAYGEGRLAGASGSVAVTASTE
jgi:hypothetical protein